MPGLYIFSNSGRRGSYFRRRDDRFINSVVEKKVCVVVPEQRGSQQVAGAVFHATCVQPQVEFNIPRGYLSFEGGETKFGGRFAVFGWGQKRSYTQI